MAEAPAAPAAVVEADADPFTTAFDSLTDLKSPPPPLDPGPVVVTETPAAPPVVVPPAPEDTGIVQPEAAAVVEAAKEPIQAAGVTDETMNRLADAIASRQAPTVVTPPPAAEPTQQVYTQADVDMLNKFETEWPDHANVLATMNRIMAHRVMAEVKTVMDARFAQSVQPLTDMTTTFAARQMLGDLHTIAPDYDTIRDTVIDWAKKAPAYLRPAYEAVIQRGTVEEIGDLISRWRQATGTPAPGAVVSATPKPADVVLSPAARQAVARLAPAASKVSAPAVGAPSTFEDAWDVAATNTV